jgi:hypothetical protein
MSDTVLVALIAASPSMIASFFGYLKLRRITALGVKNEQHLAETKASLAETKTVLAETKTAMVTLEKNTNSIKDELVLVTKIAATAQGNLEGRAELKAETNAESEEHF